MQREPCRERSPICFYALPLSFHFASAIGSYMTTLPICMNGAPIPCIGWVSQSSQSSSRGFHTTGPNRRALIQSVESDRVFIGRVLAGPSVT